MNSSFSTIATSEPTPGQPKLHTWDKDDQDGNWGKDVLDKIPGNANDSPCPKQEKMSFYTYEKLVSSGIMLILSWRNTMMKYATSS